MSQSTSTLTADEFLALPETLQRMELINGLVIMEAEPEMSPSPDYHHQAVAAELFALIKGLIPDGKALFAPMDVKLDANNVVQPDILWMSAAGRCHVVERHLQGPPDLIVEIFSPGTARRDKSDKFRLYEQHGVREYWMVDPLEAYVEVWVWHEGRFGLQGVYGPADQFSSVVLMAEVVLAGVFE